MSQLVVWYGQLTTRRRLAAQGALLAWPGVLWIALLLVLPTAALVALAFLTSGRYGRIEWTFTLDSFWRVLGYTSVGWSADYLRILGRSLVIAFVTTVLSLALAYPVAFWIAAKPRASRYLWLSLVVVPICTNVVIRAYGWKVLFAPGLFLAQGLQAIGLLDKGMGLYPSSFAVYVGMVSTFLPFAVLPIYTNVEKLDWSLVEASRDLYASKWRVFTQAILPQTLPGLTVAVLLTFVPSMGMFVISDVLGLGKYDLVGNLVERQFKSARNWPLGAALSLTLMAMTLIVVLVAWRLGRRVEVKS